jgi:cobalt/nickel transport system permease protein
MHIPDGYMSLQTSVPAFGAMIPVWSIAAGKVRKFAGGRQVPLLSLCAAFSFVIMMFNIPIGPSSVHAIGAVFAAVLLGPWAACIAVSVALVIQAFVFGDGGVLAIGLNCFNMAFVMPFAGYGIYRLVAGRSGILSKRSLTGIFLGSYAGINIAAFLTAVEFGLQPLLFKTAEGVPEYGFFPLSVSIPAIMTGHLLVAGPVEAAITVFAIAYLARFSPHIFTRNQTAGGQPLGDEANFFKRYKVFIIGLAILIAAVPLGLLASGTAWGEWGADELKNMLGFIPSGMNRLSEIWKALIPDYEIKGIAGSFAGNSIGYIISAIAGVLLIVAVMFISSRFMVKKDKKSK